MTYAHGFVLGLIQGLTEFLPISSTAHLRISAELFGWQDPGAAFTAVTQFGTESAVLIFFRRDIARITRAWLLSITGRGRSPESRLGWLVIVGTVPIVLLGLVFQDGIETSFRGLYVVAFAMLVFSGVLWVADRRPKQRKGLEELTVRDGMVLGVMQSLALIPGVSRSGGTIAGGLFLGLSRVDAARYSFLLAIPAVLGSAALEATKISSDAYVSWGPTIVATVVAFLVALAVITWLMRFISYRSFAPFIAYRIALSTLVIGALVSGII